MRLIAPCRTTRKPHTRMCPTAVSRFNDVGGGHIQPDSGNIRPDWQFCCAAIHQHSRVWAEPATCANPEKTGYPVRRYFLASRAVLRILSGVYVDLSDGAIQANNEARIASSIGMLMGVAHSRGTKTV